MTTPPSNQEQKIQVWIIEDTREFSKELSEMLDSCPGISCPRQFGSVETAVPAFKAHDCPDVVLVDIQLPGANGIEAIKQIKATHPSVHMIVLTISENRNTVFEAICAGASGYLLKNDSFEEIVNGIRLVFEGGSPLSGPIATMVLKAFKHVPFNDSTNELSEREREILTKLADGKVRKEVSQELHIAPVTVDYHLRNVYNKLQVNSQAGAVGKAIRKGLI
jgi:DNA-binding NarL/FixJ family response regulator